MRERFVATTSELLDRDERLAVVLADISAAAFEEARRRHPDRVVNVGIREQLLVSFAAGLALSGLRPIVHTYAPFLVERAFEQVKLDLGHQDLGAVLVSVGGSYDAAASGRTHHAPEDVALVGVLPGWSVVVPGHPDEAELLFRDAAAREDRMYVRLSVLQNARPRPVSPGRMHIERRGTGATFVAVGPMLDPVLEATADLDVTILYATTVRPFDGDVLLATLRGSDVVLVEPYQEGTSAAEIARALANVRHRLLCVGVPNVELRRYGDPQDHRRAHGLDAAGLRDRVLRFLDAARPAGRAG